MGRARLTHKVLMMLTRSSCDRLTRDNWWGSCGWNFRNMKKMRFREHYAPPFKTLIYLPPLLLLILVGCCCISFQIVMHCWSVRWLAVFPAGGPGSGKVTLSDAVAQSSNGKLVHISMNKVLKDYAKHFGQYESLSPDIHSNLLHHYMISALCMINPGQWNNLTLT